MRLGNIVFLPWWVVWGGGRSPKKGSSMRHFRRLYRPRGGTLALKLLGHLTTRARVARDFREVLNLTISLL